MSWTDIENALELEMRGNLPGFVGVPEQVRAIMRHTSAAFEETPRMFCELVEIVKGFDYSAEETLLSGAEGELMALGQVLLALRRSNADDDTVVINDVRVPVSESFAEQIDHVVVGPHTFLVIDTKNWGESFASTRDAAVQVVRQRRALKRTLQAAGMRPGILQRMRAIVYMPRFVGDERQADVEIVRRLSFERSPYDVPVFALAECNALQKRLCQMLGAAPAIEPGQWFK